MDLGVDAQLGQGAEQLGVEVRARRALGEREARAGAVAGHHVEAVVEQVERDLHVAGAVAGGHRPGRQPARGDVQRHVPPVVARRRERHADLAGDLGVAVQRLLRRLPRVVGQRGPGVEDGGHARQRRRRVQGRRRLSGA